jgi:hypothetical protein
MVLNKFFLFHREFIIYKTENKFCGIKLKTKYLNIIKTRSFLRVIKIYKIMLYIFILCFLSFEGRVLKNNKKFGINLYFYINNL